MKRLIYLGVLLVILLMAGFVGLSFLLDSIIRQGVETVGPQLTKTEVKLNSLRLSLLSGKGEIRGFKLGNPKGYESPYSIEVGRASLALVPTSLTSKKVVIRSIQAEAPAVTFEFLGPGLLNLRQIRKNLRASTRGSARSPKDPGTPNKQKPPGQTTLQVDEFILDKPKVRIVVPKWGGEAVSVILPRVELKGLGQGKEGITVAELGDRILAALCEASAPAVRDSMIKLGEDPGKALQNITRALQEDPDSSKN